MLVKDKRVKISIGILAHNEQEVIADTIRSLLEQSVFEAEQLGSFVVDSLEVICVPNGCTDRTEEVAASIFAEARQSGKVRYVVKSSAKAGKARAWNFYVHELSRDEVDFLILMDADIRFASSNVLELLIERLVSNQVALVSTDQALKATKLKASYSISDRASLAASQQAIDENAITGQLYCARASELRRIWMPLDLPVEDGFLAAMIVTNGFTVESRSGVISKVVEATHYFDVHEDVFGFLRHEQRIVVGSVINSWIFSKLWVEGRFGHVGQFIKQQNEVNPSWVEDLISHELATRGYWVVPKGFVLKRLRGLHGQSVKKFVKRLPIAIAATPLQILACISANRRLRQSGASRFW
jgi:glycosyltransferase involved in cell wall biosynthesis